MPSLTEAEPDRPVTMVIEPPPVGAGAPPVPSTIGRFSIIERIGTGGMGEVFSALDLSLDRKVALKVLPRRLGLDQGARTRLIREAHALAHVNHPNVVEIYEAGENDDEVFIAMELIEGPTLRWWLDNEPRGWAEVLELFVGVGQGLAAMHEQGLVHRDFKPTNVLVDEHGRARLIDFGLVRRSVPGEKVYLPTPEGEPAQRDDAGEPAPGDQPESKTDSITEQEPAPPGNIEDDYTQAESLTRTGSVMGTVMYMSPEQFWGETTTATSDQFSFCIALFEALYGCPPYGGDNYQGRAMAVNSGQIIERPRDAAVPPKLYALLARGLSRSPEDRWPTMAELLERLGRLLQRFDPEIEDPTLLRSRHRVFMGFFAFAAVVWGTVGTLAHLGRVALSPGTMAVADGTFLLGFSLAAGLSRKRWAKSRRLRLSVGFAFFVLSVYTSQDLLSHIMGRSLHHSLTGNVAFMALACFFMAPILVGALRWIAAWSALSAVVLVLLPSYAFELFVASNLGAALVGRLVQPRQPAIPWTAALGTTRTRNTQMPEPE